MSRGRLASELGVDKSAVGRWVAGTVEPSSYNLAQLTALVAARVDGFTSLDWDRDLDGLADVLGVDPPGQTRRQAPHFGDGLPLALLEQSLLTTRLRGSAYEGFFRSTRPYASHPGSFVHDQIMLHSDANGLLRLSMRSGGVSVEGWVLLLQNQLFCIGAELTSGACVFAIINGVNTIKAGLLDGLILSCALDVGRTPTASAAVFERTGDLTGDPEVDERRFAELAAEPLEATEESLSEEVRNHLVRDIGPAQLAQGGDWLLRSPIVRSLSQEMAPRS